jgi:thymidylate synthase
VALFKIKASLLKQKKKTHMASDEVQYLNLVRQVFENGERKSDRTGVGTLSIFGAQMRFDLRGGIMPLLTTKTVNWRAIVEELLWFISGSTNSRELEAKKVNIWKANATPEFLATRGLHGKYPDGFLGPVYGFQWRQCGAEYKPRAAEASDCNNDNKDFKGVDQLAEVIRQIKEEPDSRRIIMSAWNVMDLPKMALPPCHVLCQFYVSSAKGELSCQLYQRSGDLGLGVPFNIASYALLTHLIAHICGLQAGDFVHTIGDAHVYINHISALREQLMREVQKPFPKVQLSKHVKDINDIRAEDIFLVGYEPQKPIKMDMAL